MIILKKADQLSFLIEQQKKSGKKIGFVPTMGALHKGHLSLIETCKNSSDITVCSIFVNPTQFNNPEDFQHYPITVEKDILQLIEAKCDVLFLPSVEEIYPPDYQKKIYPLGEIENILEGFYRPGHFQGVCEVVNRLLEIVQPDNLYMGQKDFQQCMVIKKLLQITGRENQIHLTIVPTVREKNGLAMSSRNLRLSEEQRQLATAISQQLFFIKENISTQPIEQLKQTAKEQLTQKGFAVDYVEIADANDLSSPKKNKPLIALIAASIGNIRLIDNMLLS